MAAKLRLTERQKINIILLQGKSFGSISRTLGIPRSTVFFFLRKWDEHGTIHNIKAAKKKKFNNMNYKENNLIFPHREVIKY